MQFDPGMEYRPDWGSISGGGPSSSSSVPGPNGPMGMKGPPGLGPLSGVGHPNSRVGGHTPDNSASSRLTGGGPNSHGGGGTKDEKS